MPGWLPWLAGAAVLAVATAWVLLRRGGPRPRRGEIWWADVPFTDGTGSKVRPCLVLLRRRRGTVVLKITSQDKSRRRDHITIPTRAWDPYARHDSYLNLGEPITVQAKAFRRRVAPCDPALLRRIADHGSGAGRDPGAGRNAGSGRDRARNGQHPTGQQG